MQDFFLYRIWDGCFYIKMSSANRLPSAISTTPPAGRHRGFKAFKVKWMAISPLAYPAVEIARKGRADE
jgi:hypothetical protein